MNKNAFSRKMINQYYEEMAVITEENTEIGIDTPVIDTSKKDPLWDCWYEVSFLYEPECTKDAVQMTTSQDEQSEFDVDDLFYDEMVYELNSKDEYRIRVSKRRKNAALHKRKTSRNVTVIWDNYGERAKTDMHNWSFQKQKNGERIDAPKSQEEKADKILKRALKIGAVPKELCDEITEYLNGRHEMASFVMGSCFYSERKNCKTEVKAKQEIQEMAA